MTEEQSQNVFRREHDKDERMSPARYFMSQVIFWTRVVVRAIWCTIMIIVFIFAYFGLIIPFLPFRYIWPRFWWAFEGKLYRWLMACVGYWGYTSGYDVIEYGDDLSEACKSRCLVICNHQSTADVPTLMTVLQSKGKACRKSCWIMAGMFKWSPFGLIAQVHGDHFVWEGKDIRQQEVENITKHLRKTYWDRDRWWVILFPEGGFLYKRKEGSQAYAIKHNYPHLEHVTLPRTGAFMAVLQAVGPRKGSGNAVSFVNEDNGEASSQSETDLQTLGSESTITKSAANNGQDGSDDDSGSRSMTARKRYIKIVKDTFGAIREKKYVKVTRPPIKYIMDVTIGFQNGEALSADQLWFGTRREVEDIHVYYKLYDIDKVPFSSEEDCKKWLYDRYVEKEKMLDSFYKTGEMVPGEYGRRIHFPLLKILGQYLFWFGVAYGNYRLYLMLAKAAFHAIASLF